MSKTLVAIATAIAMITSGDGRRRLESALGLGMSEALMKDADTLDPARQAS